MADKYYIKEMGVIDHVRSSDLICVGDHILPWSKYFNVKNSDNEITAISTEWAKKIGFRNPIDILGTTAYDMKCPGVDLAEAFCTQDKEVITTQSTKRYLMFAMTNSIDIKAHIYQKSCLGNSVIANHRPLDSGKFSNYFYNRISTIDRKYYRKMQRCYELVRCYDGLSIRESEVMYYLMLGLSSSDIAGILRLSKRTVQHHVERIKMKMSAQTARQLVELGLYLSFNTKIPERIMY